MDLGLKGQVALVAASSKGLGRATALQLAEEGARVVICARGKAALELPDATWEVGKTTHTDHSVGFIVEAAQRLGQRRL